MQPPTEDNSVHDRVRSVQSEANFVTRVETTCRNCTALASNDQDAVDDGEAELTVSNSHLACLRALLRTLIHPPAERYTGAMENDLRLEG